MFHHRAGKLKQKNKKHKNRGHLASKRSVKREEGGKVNAGAAASGGQQRVGLKQQLLGRDLKQDRLNRARQLKEQKRHEQFLQRRIGSADGPPRIVAILPLSSLCNTAGVRDALLAAHPDVATVAQEGGALTAAFKGLKQRFTFLLPRFGLMEALEAAKVADLVMFVLDVARGSEGAISEEGDLIISAIRAQGLPTTVGIVQGLELHQGLKSQGELKRFGHRFFETEFGDKAKVAEANNAAQLQRVLTTPVGTGLHWRQNRPYLVADHVAWTAAPEGAEGAGGEGEERLGTLTLRGYVRGKPLSVNQLLHLPGLGTFTMSQIRRCRQEPCPLREPRRGAGAAAMEEGGEGEEGEEVLARVDPGKVEALTTLAEPDELAGEQTWPTREEEAAAAAAMAADGEGGEEGAEERWRRKKEKLMKSMSEYQAAWFEGEEDEESGGEEGSDGEEDEEYDDASLMAGLSAAGGKKGGKAAAEGEGDGSGMDVQQQKEKRKLEVEDLEFPDEVQTPEDMPARERFARYRALKSFRTSPWDPYESLPREYARIFKFQNFQASHARVLAEMEEVEKAQNQIILDSLLGTSGRPRAASTATAASGSGSGGHKPASMSMDVDGDGEQQQGQGQGGVETAAAAVAARFEGFVASGTYVSVDVANVPQAAAAAALQRVGPGALPLVAFALLRYENRTSVLHFNIQKHPTYEPAVKSKERLLFYTGFRAFEAKPIFSELNLNCDKHKFSRFLHAGRFGVATAFGPVSMPPCPVLIFKETHAPGPDNAAAAAAAAAAAVVVKRELVASGTLHAVDPDRIILKRIVLTGYPIRVKRRSAVVKHMFYNPEDVKWFKPAELGTKQGAAGHIRMPVGTHGLMKVRFNRVIQQSDTVCLALYKRVFPKFVEDVVDA